MRNDPLGVNRFSRALLKGAVSDDDEDEVEDEEELKQQKRIEDMDENDQPEYSMKEIKTVLEEAAEDIEESGIFDDLAENIEEIVRVGSFKAWIFVGRAKRGDVVAERRRRRRDEHNERLSNERDDGSCGERIIGG